MKQFLIAVLFIFIAWNAVAFAQVVAGADEPIPTGPPGVMQTIQMGIYTVMKFWARRHDPNVEKSVKSGTFWMNVVSILCTTAVQILQAIPHGVAAAPPIVAP